MAEDFEGLGDQNPDPDDLDLTPEELEMIQSFQNDLGGDFAAYPEKRLSAPEAPTFSSAGLVEHGAFNDEDCAVIARLRAYEECPLCASETKVCPDKFAHIGELAFERIYHITQAVQKLLQNRLIVRSLGADTQSDLDLTIVSLSGEMSRIMRLVPKLGHAQDGMNTTQ